jgi:hypothetical protein
MPVEVPPQRRVGEAALGYMSQYSPQTGRAVRPREVDTSSRARPAWSPPHTSASRAQDRLFVSFTTAPGADIRKTRTPLLPGPTQFLMHFASSTLRLVRLPSNRIFASRYCNSRTTLVLALSAKNRQNPAACRSLALSEPTLGAARACDAARLQAAMLSDRKFTERAPEAVSCAAC